MDSFEVGIVCGFVGAIIFSYYYFKTFNK